MTPIEGGLSRRRRGRKRTPKWPRHFATRREYAVELRAIAAELRFLAGATASLVERREALRHQLNELAAIGDGQFGPSIPDTTWRASSAGEMAEIAEVMARKAEEQTVVLRVVDGGAAKPNRAAGAETAAGCFELESKGGEKTR